MSNSIKRAKKLFTSMIGDNAFVNMVSGLGTIRDKSSHGTYAPVNRKTVGELNTMYHQDWVARRVIDRPAQDSMRAGWYYKNIDTDNVKRINLELKRLKVKKSLLRAVVLSRLHGWCYILIGANSSTDLEQPLDASVEGLSFLTVMKREQMNPKTDGDYLPAELTAGLFTEPEFYEIGKYGNKKTIHHSRVIRIDAPDLVGDNEGMSMPLLQQIYDALIRSASVNSNASSLVYEAKVDVIRMPNLMAGLLENPSGTINSMITRMASVAQLKGNNGMIVLDSNEEYESKSYSFSGLPDLMREFAVQTSGAANIPYSLLFGQSPSGMNATGDFDMRSYYDSISMMQENVLREPLELILDMIGNGIGIDGAGDEIVFNTLWQLDEKTKSEVEKNNSDRDEKYLDMGVVTELQIAKQLIEEGTYTVIDDEHLEALSLIERFDDDDADI